MVLNKNIAVVVCIFLLIAGALGCAKEYSYEGGPLPGFQTDTSIVIAPDSVNQPGVVSTACNGCSLPDTTVNKWSFSTGNARLCGSVTNTVISFDGNAMTFFGPSMCSIDSGLVITAFFTGRALTKDQQSITATLATMEYYDNTTQIDVLRSKPPNTLSFTMYNYIKQSGTAYGIFSGWVVDKNNVLVRIDSGKFTLKF